MHQCGAPSRSIARTFGPRQVVLLRQCLGSSWRRAIPTKSDALLVEAPMAGALLWSRSQAAFFRQDMSDAVLADVVEYLAVMTVTVLVSLVVFWFLFRSK